jgi:hypothetical protein
MSSTAKQGPMSTCLGQSPVCRPAIHSKTTVLIHVVHVCLPSSGTVRISPTHVHDSQYHIQPTCFLLQAVDLSKLDLSHNHITQLPQQLYDLSGLVTLLARYDPPSTYCQQYCTPH